MRRQTTIIAVILCPMLLTPAGAPAAQVVQESGGTLELLWEGPGIEKQAIPAEALSH